MPPTAHFRGQALFTLATVLETKYETAGDVDAGRELVMIRRATLDATGADHSLRGLYLAALSISLHTVFHRTGDRRMLAEAVTTGRAAIAAVPASYPSAAWYQVKLAETLDCLHDTTGDEQALAEALRASSEVLATASALPLYRVSAGRELIRKCLTTGDFDVALETAEEVVELLPGFATRAMRRQDREARLGDIMGFAAQVAAAALAASQPRRAMELAEELRGRLLAEAMDSRTDLVRLRACSTQLAAEFERVEDEFAALDAAGADAAGTTWSGRTWSARPPGSQSLPVRRFRPARTTPAS